MEEIYWYCRRIGFDNIVGYLPEGIEMWQENGNEVGQVDKNKTNFVLCSSGNRATTASSYLEGKGYHSIVITGGAEMYRNFV